MFTIRRLEARLILFILCMCLVASQRKASKEAPSRSRRERMTVGVGMSGESSMGEGEGTPKWMQTRPIQRKKRSEGPLLTRSYRGISMTFAQLHRNKRLSPDVVGMLEEYRSHVLLELARHVAAEPGVSRTITYRQVAHAARVVFSQIPRPPRGLGQANTAVLSFTKTCGKRGLE